MQYFASLVLSGYSSRMVGGANNCVSSNLKAPVPQLISFFKGRGLKDNLKNHPILLCQC